MKCEAVNMDDDKVCDSTDKTEHCIIQGEVARIKMKLCSFHQALLNKKYKVWIINQPKEKENGQ